MKSTILVARAGALSFLLLSAVRLSAADGVTRWERTFRSPQAGVGNQGVLAARELADGTTLTVVGDNAGLTTLHYDHAGTLLSSSTFYPTYFPSKIAIDAFGGLVLACTTTEGSDFRNDLWLRKFDGLTGEALWPAGVSYGAANHGNDEAVAVFVDPAGDVLLEASGDFVASHAFSKYRGTDGALLWGPVTLANAAYSIAALDASGNLVLAQQTGSGPNAVFRVTQYAGATGAIGWQTVEAGHDLVPVTLGLDGSGNFVVTGRASGSAGTVEADRYAGESGQRIWGPAIWTPPAGNSGTAPVVAAVGADGSVVIFATTTGQRPGDRVAAQVPRRGWRPALGTHFQHRPDRELLRSDPVPGRERRPDSEHTVPRPIQLRIPDVAVRRVHRQSPLGASGFPELGHQRDVRRLQRPRVRGGDVLQRHGRRRPDSGARRVDRRSVLGAQDVPRRGGWLCALLGPDGVARRQRRRDRRRAGAGRNRRLGDAQVRPNDRLRSLGPGVLHDRAAPVTSTRRGRS